MVAQVAMVGFGEAASAFAAASSAPARYRVFDIKTDDPSSATAKRADYICAGVIGCDTLVDALDGVAAAFSLVVANQALASALEAAPLLARGTFWFDMNSVAPATKRMAAAAVQATGGRYIDVAVMAPAYPARLAVPLILAGPHAEEGAALLRSLGFKNVRVVAGAVGRASAIKMIRSVIVKGVEALTAECALAAVQADVLEEVLASLDASPPPAAWRDRVNHNLDRMIVHGLRRAAEMEEVVKTLDEIGTGSVMSRATVAGQRKVGRIGPTTAPAALLEKLAMLTPDREAHAA